MGEGLARRGAAGLEGQRNDETQLLGAAPGVGGYMGLEDNRLRVPFCLRPLPSEEGLRQTWKSRPSGGDAPEP